MPPDPASLRASRAIFRLTKLKLLPTGLSSSEAIYDCNGPSVGAWRSAPAQALASSCELEARRLF